MSENPLSVRKHYQEQSLSSETALRIIAQGRILASRRRRLRYIWLSAAAVVALCVGAALFNSGRPDSGSSLLATADLEQAVEHYFSWPTIPLSHVDSDPRSLQRWLQSKRSPADFVLPNKLTMSEGVGCRVLKIRGQRVSLLCFYVDSVEPHVAGAAGRASQSSIKQAWAFFFGAPRPMIHLLVAPRAAFNEAPQPGAIVRMNAAGQWQFATWSTADNVFMAATESPNVPLAQLLSAM